MKKQILIVDDDKSILKSLTMLLQDNYDITLASCGQDALKYLTEKSFHCVICDFYMENGDGVSVLKGNQKVPTIIMTGHGKKELFLEFANLHAYHILEKPLKAESVEKAITNAVQYFEEKQKASDFARIGENSAKVIHDINNPLSIMMLALETTKEKVPLNENHQKFVRRVERGIEMLKNTLDSFKDDNSPNGQKFDIVCTTQEVIESFKPMFETESVTVTMESPGQLHAFSSSLKFRRALENLLKNSIDALKHQSDKKIIVRVLEEKNMVKVLVEDNGPGISSEVRDNLFNKGATSKGNKGTGIGLWGSKDNLNKLGAELQLKTTSSRGCVFEVSLPKERDGKV